jgi:hypothetical protein
MAEKRPFRLTHSVVPESAVLEAVLQLLAVHPMCAWAARFNSGAMAIGQGSERRYVRFHTMPGMSDVLGQLKAPWGGRLVAIECKRAGMHPTPEQQSFLDTVNKAGGLALVATSADQVADALAKLAERRQAVEYAPAPLVSRLET